jgi:hypothetical protein
MSDIIVRAAGGQDLLKAPRLHEPIDPSVATLLGKALEDEQAFAARLEAWLARRRRP